MFLIRKRSNSPLSGKHWGTTTTRFFKTLIYFVFNVVFHIRFRDVSTRFPWFANKIKKNVFLHVAVTPLPRSCFNIVSLGLVSSSRHYHLFIYFVQDSSVYDSCSPNSFIPKTDFVHIFFLVPLFMIDFCNLHCKVIQRWCPVNSD